MRLEGTLVPLLLAGVAALLGLLAGAPWWILAAALPAAAPWRWPPVLSAAAIVALLPWGTGPLWMDLACFTAGLLAAWAALHRLGGAVPWVAVPWFLGGLLALGLLWPVLPPAGYWADADVAVRARILVLAALAVVGSAVHYLPRYRDWRRLDADAEAVQPDAPA